MRIFDGIDDFAQNVGKEIGVGEWRVVGQADINDFATLTGDEQWIHVDPERAAHGPYGTTVAHGYLTLSMVPSLVRSAYRVDGLAMSVNYGSNRVRYPAPVPSGAAVRARVTLLSLAREKSWAQAVTQVTIERPSGDDEAKPACVAEIVTRLYEPQPALV